MGPTPLSQIRNQPKSGYINPKIVSTMNPSIWHHIWTILEFFSIFACSALKICPRKISKNLIVLSEILLKGINGPNLGFLEHSEIQKVLLVWFWDIAQYVPKTNFEVFFGQNRVKTFILGMNSSTKRGGYILPPLLNLGKSFFEWYQTAPTHPCPPWEFHTKRVNMD